MFPDKSSIAAAVLLTAIALPAMSHPAGAETIYVSNEKDNTVSVIDGETLKVTATIKTGRRPRGIVLSTDMTKLYVCVGDDDRVDVVDLNTRKVIGRLPSGPDPELLALHPDGHHLYVANEDDNMVTVVDVDTKKMLNEIQVGVEPEGMGISPDGTLLVNTSETTNMAHFIDTKSREIVANVLVDSRPRVAEFTPDSKQVWVSAEIGGTVSVIESGGKKVIHKIRFEIPGVSNESIQPVGMKFTKDGKRAFVALGPANRVAEIDPATFEVKKYYLVGQRVWNLALGQNETRLYTTNGVSSDVSVIDLEREKVIKSLTVGRAPWGVAVKP
ncbi:membrane protein [Skermanella stibiiresistens SB22]|uniref:Membrane protein n=1 Tax=Skermanella stibiiresistens SB22 TaxID=1385369 RepID=W9H8H3_9PROT|nr:PQQ-dependent catabolism-associated beta-propeller protein [Skermanella stibiiresistens]EWY41056.1 membrane protein [Skermanella stibiiresistens SB22]